jgi:hypothetical protein
MSDWMVGSLAWSAGVSLSALASAKHRPKRLVRNRKRPRLPGNNASATALVSPSTGERWRRMFGAGAMAAAMVASIGVRSETGVIGYENGTALYSACVATHPVQQGVCIGFVEAVSDVVVGPGFNGVKACPAQTVSVGQTRDIVVQYLAANPARRHLEAAGLAAIALAEAFPCR